MSGAARAAFAEMLPLQHPFATPCSNAQFEWRNGWFYGLSTAALAAGKPDPCPRHTALLKELGTVS